MKFFIETNCDSEDSFEFKVEFPKTGQFIEIGSKSSLNDVALFIGSLLVFNELSLDSKFVGALFMEEELALSGGLLFEKNGVLIRSSCCADIQDWENIVESVKKKESPWMGHDPSPWFEFDGDNITLWSDKEVNNLTFIKINQQEFNLQLLAAKKELDAFLIKVDDWAKENYIQNPNKLVAGVKKFLCIKSN